eukprot:g32399.t1
MLFDFFSRASNPKSPFPASPSAPAVSSFPSSSSSSSSSSSAAAAAAAAAASTSSSSSSPPPPPSSSSSPSPPPSSFSSSFSSSSSSPSSSSSSSSSPSALSFPSPSPSPPSSSRSPSVSFSSRVRFPGMSDPPTPVSEVRGVISDSSSHRGSLSLLSLWHLYIRCQHLPALDREGARHVLFATVEVDGKQPARTEQVLWSPAKEPSRDKSAQDATVVFRKPATIELPQRSHKYSAEELAQGKSSKEAGHGGLELLIGLWITAEGAQDRDEQAQPVWLIGNCVVSVEELLESPQEGLEVSMQHTDPAQDQRLQAAHSTFLLYASASNEAPSHFDQAIRTPSHRRSSSSGRGWKDSFFSSLPAASSVAFAGIFSKATRRSPPSTNSSHLLFVVLRLSGQGLFALSDRPRHGSCMVAVNDYTGALLQGGQTEITKLEAGLFRFQPDQTFLELPAPLEDGQGNSSAGQSLRFSVYLIQDSKQDAAYDPVLLGFAQVSVRQLCAAAKNNDQQKVQLSHPEDATINARLLEHQSCLRIQVRLLPHERWLLERAKQEEDEEDDEEEDDDSEQS